MVETATQPLAWHDLQHCLRCSPNMLLAACKHFGKDLMIAGGFIRSCVAHEEINDIDVFVPTKTHAIAILQWMLKYETDETGSVMPTWKKHVHETPNAYTVDLWKTPIQFVHRWTFSNPVDAIQSFDFTIARGAFWWEKKLATIPGDDGHGNPIDIPVRDEGSWKSVTDVRFYADLAAKRLIYTMPIRNEDAGGSMLRVLKYYQRGYRIPVDHLGAVMARLMMGVRYRAIEESDEKSWHEPLEVKLAGDITRLLREVDPDIDPRHIAHLPAENTIK